MAAQEDLVNRIHARQHRLRNRSARTGKAPATVE
jgi:hypothetical protein